ncbi:MAG: hypothetical protein R3D62_08185 [Xanthobacteraceae bacterium]
MAANVIKGSVTSKEHLCRGKSFTTPALGAGLKMSTIKAASVPKPSSGDSMMNAFEEGLCPALQRILDAQFQNLAVLTNTLSDPEISATTEKLLSELKTQQDILIANISGSLALVDEMWLLLQQHFEHQLALISQTIDGAERSAIGLMTLSNNRSE